MATQTKPKTRRVRSPQPRLRNRAYGAPVPEALHDAIENERSNLSTAESVLGCLVIAMEYESDSVDKPYYPDVAELARQLVRKSINGLDSLVLQRHLLRDKIRECPDVPCVQGGYAAVASDISFERSFGMYEELRLCLPIMIRAFDQGRAAALE